MSSKPSNSKEDLNFECMSFAFDITASGEMRVTLPKGKSLTVPFGTSFDFLSQRIDWTRPKVVEQ